MTKTYSVGKVMQLVDLNQDSVNFEITFKVASKNGEPFDALVVDQTTMDNNPNLEYKKVTNGVMTGTIKNNNNVYQNYFLVLKADQNCLCDVDIQKNELPQIQPPQQLQQNPEPVKNGFNWFKILLILAVVIAAGYVLYWLSQKKSTQKPAQIAPQAPVANAGFRFYTPSLSPSPTQSPMASSSHGDGACASPPVANSAILQKLRKLNL